MKLSVTFVLLSGHSYSVTLELGELSVVWKELKTPRRRRGIVEFERLGFFFHQDMKMVQALFGEPHPAYEEKNFHPGDL